MNQPNERYPIGQFEKPAVIDHTVLSGWIQVITQYPDRLKAEVQKLTEEQLDTPYRTGGWTIRQVVNHTADSHMNAFIRIKLALTENLPVIKPYEEALWAELPDSKNYPIHASLSILEGLHNRWQVLLTALTDAQLKRCFVHPEHGKQISIEEAIGMYSWHCKHHLAHITSLKTLKGWY